MSDNESYLNNSTVYKVLNNIINEHIDYVGYAADVLCIGFGIKIPVCIDEKVFNKAKFYLHIQCDWVASKNNKQICSRKKLFSTQNNNTEALLTLSEVIKNSIVKDICVFESDIVEITFENDIKLQIIYNKSISGEEWRFINYVDGYHYVVSSKNNCLINYIL